MNNSNYHIRQATENDIPFLVKTILGADAGNGQVASYAAVFGLSIAEATQYISEMMTEEMEGCELSPLHFLVAEYENEVVAATAAWVEESDGIASWVVRSALFQEYLPAEAIEHAQSISELAQSMVLKRSPGTMQLESLFVEPAHRGKGLALKLFAAQSELISKNFPDVKIAQLMTYTDNLPAIGAYEKMGFSKIRETISSDPNVLKYYPSHGMLIMEIELKNLLK
jgi:ribosomal protein S18 acetylase RimI-like enzyme